MCCRSVHGVVLEKGKKQLLQTSTKKNKLDALPQFNDAMRRFAFCFLTVILSATSSLAAPDFGRDIQPIFARHCYECHGQEKQKGQLRLDERSSALRIGEKAVIVPGKPNKSDLYRRITLSK